MTIEVKEYMKKCVFTGILIIGIRFSCAMLSNQINIFDNSNEFIIEWIVVTLYYLWKTSSKYSTSYKFILSMKADFELWQGM
jgi:hypothetical protein